MGIGVSLILIAVGAILTWAVETSVSGLDVNAVGVILMIVGAIGFTLSMLFWSSFWGPGYFRRTYAEGPAVGRRRYRQAAPAEVVEEEIVEDYPTSDSSQDGSVVDEQPAPGTKAPKGSQIIIYVGRLQSTG